MTHCAGLPLPAGLISGFIGSLQHCDWPLGFLWGMPAKSFAEGATCR